jgi:26S proteasome regulatory subunit N5
MQTASDLLSELQVETYSSMDRREKTQFILEQMRLLIAVARTKDAEGEKGGKDALSSGEAEWIKVRVGGRKINEAFLAEKDNEVCSVRFWDCNGDLNIGLQDLKLKYYDLMIQHALNASAYLDCAKYYYKVWETPSIKEDVEYKGKAVGFCLSICLCFFLTRHTGARTHCLLYRPRPT